MASKKPVVLCIDDEAVILQSLKEQLQDFLNDGYLLEVAENGESALEIIQECIEEGREVALVLVDYLMPGIKGDQVLVDIHNLSPMTLCIMLTGQADLSAVANAINHQALFRYMSKPWNKDDLVKTVSEAFHRTALEKEIVEKQRALENQNSVLAILNQQLEERMKTFYKFVPIEFLKILNIASEIGHIALGESCQKELAVLFTDVRSFTKSTQHLPTNEIFNFVNSFTSVIAPIIIQHKGFIDKFIGDAVLSIYMNVDDCLSAVFQILKAFSSLPPENSLSKIKIGFALNFGPVEMGTVGYSERMETTILGKVVNIAAKIEKMNKIYNTTLILTEDVVKVANKKRFLFNLLDETQIPGIDHPIKLYTATEIENPKEQI